MGELLFQAIFINSQSEINFTLWAFAYCLLQASSDWHWLTVDGVVAVLRSERMGRKFEHKQEAETLEKANFTRSRRRRRWQPTNLLSVIMWHKRIIPLSGKRVRFFPKTATNSLDGLGRLFTSSGGKNVQWITTLGNSNYLPRTFPFSRTVRLSIPHLWRVNASLTKPAVNSRRKLTR